MALRQPNRRPAWTVLNAAAASNGQKVHSRAVLQLTQAGAHFAHSKPAIAAAGTNFWMYGGELGTDGRSVVACLCSHVWHAHARLNAARLVGFGWHKLAADGRRHFTKCSRDVSCQHRDVWR